MSRRKGELSSSAISREWPHQVALLASAVSGKNYTPVHALATAFESAPQTLTARHNDTDYVIFAFREFYQAAMFRAKSNGEFFDPKDRGRGGLWRMWNKPQGAPKELASTEEVLASARSILVHLQSARSLADHYQLVVTAYHIDRAVDDPQFQRTLKTGSTGVSVR